MGLRLVGMGELCSQFLYMGPSFPVVKCGLVVEGSVARSSSLALKACYLFCVAKLFNE